MTDEPNSDFELPEIMDVADIPPNDHIPVVARVSEQPAPLPRPGFFEAVLWCAIFLATQILATLVVVPLVFAFFAVQQPDPMKFVDNQIKGLTESNAKTDRTVERPPMPMEIGVSLAWGMLAAQFSSLGLIVLVLPWRIGKDWKRQIGVRWPSLLQVILLILLAPGFLVLSSGIQQLLQLVGITVPDTNEVLKGVFKPFPWFLTFLAVGLGPGLVEELWCRGFVGRGLSARYGLVTGIALTSVMFGLLHMSLIYAIPTAIMGAYLHFVYLASRSIWVSVLLHTLNNSFAIWASQSGVGDHLDNAPAGMMAVVFLLSFALVLFGSIALWTTRPRIVSVQGDENWQTVTDWRPEYPGISAPPLRSQAYYRRGAASPVALAFTGIFFIALIVVAFR